MRQRFRCPLCSWTSRDFETWQENIAEQELGMHLVRRHFDPHRPGQQQPWHGLKFRKEPSP